MTPGNFYEEGGFKRNAEKDKYYSHSFPEEYLLKRGDIVVAMTEQSEGLLGSMAKVPEDHKFLHNQRLGLVTAQNSDLYLDFIYHLFRSDYVRKQIQLTSTGSKVKHTAPERIYDLLACLPPLHEQKKIAAVLSAFDAKIELNNRINAELEAMAKTLYDYWFVQFDFPFDFAQGRPDANGRPYKSSGGKMVYNETLKRDIPEGWAASNILAVADLFGGGTPTKKKPEFWNGTIPFFTPTDADGNIFKFETGASITKEGLEKSSTRLFEKNSVFITARGSVGKLVLAGGDMAMSQSCYALRALDGISYTFLFFLTKELIHHLTVKASGSVFNSIVSNDIEFTNLAIPSVASIEKFAEIVEPAFEQISKNARENQQLTSLRDWLLPMLMNGQVQVGESES